MKGRLVIKQFNIKEEQRNIMHNNLRTCCNLKETECFHRLIHAY